MPDETNEGQTTNTDATATGSDAGTQPDDSTTILNDKRVQSEIDRRVTAALQKAELKAKEREAAAAEKAKREFQDAKLLEDKNFQELAARKEREAAEALAKLEQYEHNAKVGQLLDKKGVTDPELRALWMRFNGDLTELDPAIDRMEQIVNERVEKVVNERLKTAPTPPKSGAAPAPTSLRQQISDAEKAGNWALAATLTNQLTNELSKARRAQRATSIDDIKSSMIAS